MIDYNLTELNEFRNKMRGVAIEVNSLFKAYNFTIREMQIINAQINILGQLMQEFVSDRK